MKNRSFSPLHMLALACIVFGLGACNMELDFPHATAPGNPTVEWRSNSVVYPPTARPYGKSYEEWAQEFWIRLMAFDCDQFFSEGVNALNQDQPVFLLSGPIGTFETDVTIPRDKPVFSPIFSYLSDYPCPFPDFEPAPGQTLEEFLQAGAAAAIDMVINISATLDGESIEGLDAYRFSTDMFTFTGHPSLAECADPCVTGEPQQAVTDGYFLILKKLSPGQHTLHLSGEVPAYNLVLDGTFHITVE